MNQDIGLKFKIIDEALARQANAQLQAVGLTFSQANMLGALAQQDGFQTTQRHLEELLGVSHPTIVGLVKRLEAKGYVDTFFSAEDARMKIVRLTDTGTELVNDGASKRNEAEKWLTKGLTDQESSQLNRLLQKVLDDLEQ